MPRSVARAADEPLAEHGTVKRYAQGCTCDPCAVAAAFYQRWWDSVPVDHVDPEVLRRERNQRERAAFLERKRQAG